MNPYFPRSREHIRPKAELYAHTCRKVSRNRLLNLARPGSYSNALAHPLQYGVFGYTWLVKGLILVSAVNLVPVDRGSHQDLIEAGLGSHPEQLSAALLDSNHMLSFVSRTLEESYTSSASKGSNLFLVWIKEVEIDWGGRKEVLS